MLARGVAILFLGCVAATAAAADPRPPTGKWVVHFDDAQCVATRRYGPEDESVYLTLKAPPVGDVLQIGIIRKGGYREAIQTRGEVVFDNGEPVVTNLLEFGIKKLGQRAMLVNLPTQALAPLRQASSVRIRARDISNVTTGSRIALASTTLDETFGLSQMSSLLKMVDTCTADLRKVWNVYDDSKAGPLKQPASGEIKGLFRSYDYPGIALLQDQMGDVALVMLIDEQGKVADCTVTQTSGVPVLDAQSCAVVKERGRFSPAIGQDGKPAKSSWLQRIRWRLEP
jgi:TonB family protein